MHLPGDICTGGKRVGNAAHSTPSISKQRACECWCRADLPTGPHVSTSIGGRVMSNHASRGTLEACAVQCCWPRHWPAACSGHAFQCTGQCTGPHTDVITPRCSQFEMYTTFVHCKTTLRLRVLAGQAQDALRGWCWTSKAGQHRQRACVRHRLHELGHCRTVSLEQLSPSTNHNEHSSSF